MVANTELLMLGTGSVVRANLNNPSLERGNVQEITFRQKLETLLDSNTLPKMSPDLRTSEIEALFSETTSLLDENKELDFSSDNLEKLLAEIENLSKEEKEKSVSDNSEIESILVQIPADILAQVHSFIESVINGTNKLQLDNINKTSELIGLLSLVTNYVKSRNHSDSTNQDLKIFIKQVKMIINELFMKSESSGFSSNGEARVDSKSLKVIHEILQGLESKLLPKEVQVLTRNRSQYLQAVHSRYFTIPKGMENPTNDTTEKLLQKVSTPNNTSALVIDSTVVNDPMTPQMTKPQQFSIFVEQNGRQLPSQEQFIRQFQNILAKSSFVNGGSQQKLLIKLYPEHLGALRIEILQNESGMVARIMASTNQAKELVESQLSSLKHSFTMQNISIDKIEVSNQLQYQSERNLQRESEHQKQQSQQYNDDNKKQDSDEDNTFVSALLDELVNIKV